MSRNTLCLVCGKPFTVPSDNPGCTGAHSKSYILSPLSDLEKSIYRKVSGASFPPATASKRFMQGDPELVKLSDKGRRFMAFVANRFRRQYVLTEEEWAWVREWKYSEAA